MLRTTSIKTRLIGGFGLIFLIFLAVNIVVIGRMDSLANLTNLMYRHPLTVSNAVLRIDGNIVRMHHSMKDVTLAQNDAEIDAASKQVDEYEQAVYHDFIIIEERFLGDKTMYEETLTTFSDWKEIRDDVISLMYQGKREEAAAIIKGIDAQHVDKINVAMLNLGEFAQNKAASFLSDALDAKNELLHQISIIFAILIVSELFLAILITRSIVQPLTELMTGVIEIKEGHLEKRIVSESNDEIGQLGAAFNEMAEKLKKSYTNLENKVRERSRQLSESNQELKKEIIERSRVEESLRLLSQAIDQSPVSVVITDTKGSILYVNSHFCQLTGYTFAEAVGENPSILKSEKQSSEFYKGMWETLVAGEAWQGDFHNRKKNGDLYWESASIAGVKNIDGEITHYIAVKEDISQRKQTEESLRKSEAILLETGRMARVGGWEVDAQTYAITWTKETYHIHELPFTHVPSPGNALSFFHPDDRPKLELASENAFDHGQPYDMEIRLITAKGKHLWVHTTCKPVVVDGQTVKLIGAIQDITERKWVENELQKRNWELDKLYNASDALFSSAVSGVESLSQSIVSAIQQRFRYSNCSLFLIEKNRPELRRIAAIGPYASGLTNWIFPIDGNGLAPFVARSGQMLNVPDVTLHPDYVQGWQAACSELVVPLTIDDWVIGVIDLQSSELADFDENDERLLTAFASRAAQALHNARLLEQSQRRAQELETLRQTSLQLNSGLNLQQVLETTLHYALQIMNALNAHLFLYDGKNLTLGAAIWADEKQQKHTITTPRPGGLTETVAHSRKPIIVTDVNQHPLYKKWQWGGAIIGLPLNKGDQVLGVMNIGFEKPRFFTDNELRLLELLSAQVAVALDNIRLFDETRRRAEELEVMTTISSALRTAQTQPEMLMIVLNEAVTLVNADRAALAINDPDTGEICFDLARGEWAQATGLRFPVGEGVTGEVIRTGLPYVGRYGDDGLHFLPTTATATGNGYAATCVPLIVSEGVIGALWLGREAEIKPEEVVLLTAIVDIAANAIQRISLYEETLVHTAQLEKRVDKRTAELSRSNAELARATRLKDEFLANMSHELRTPLTAVLGRSDLLQEEIYGPLNERQMHALKDITESGRHLLDLINDILDLSKIGVGKLDLEISTVAVESVSQASLRIIKEMALKKQLRVTSSFDNKITTMQADPRRLKQILVNLLGNAIKFTPERGELGLDVSVDTAEGLIQFTVWDTGIGIAPDQMSRLFQPFVQLDSSLGRQHEGTGLGLSLVARLTEMHGGNVSVESKVGLGSRFTVTLPWKEPIHIGTKPLETIEYDLIRFAQLPPINRVLIIEDSLTAADQIAIYLSEFGTDITIYPQGLGALDKAIEIEPQLIILDIQLPDALGWDILQQIKQEPRTQNIPVLIISIVDERQHGFHLGAAEYLVKPIFKKEIQRAILNIFNPSTEQFPALIAAPMKQLILLAEDNEANIVTIGDFIQAVGYRIVVARNGAEAIERANELSPDIIIMDIQMPGIDGLEATRRLRANADFDKTPIIALTGLAMPGDRERCLAAGANEYMAKPVNFSRLHTVINSLLQDFGSIIA